MLSASCEDPVQVTTLHALYDGVGAITRWYHDKSNDTVVVGFQFGRDKVGNPAYELREHQSNEGDEYSYDALHRLTRTIYDDATPATPTGSPSASVTDDFLYDLIGNRTTAYQKSADATTYLHNPANEYAKESTDGTDTYFGHDAAGNLLPQNPIKVGDRWRPTAPGGTARVGP